MEYKAKLNYKICRAKLGRTTVLPSMIFIARCLIRTNISMITNHVFYQLKLI